MKEKKENNPINTWKKDINGQCTEKDILNGQGICEKVLFVLESKICKLKQK